MKSWFSFNLSCREHLEVADVLEYCSVFAVNNENLHTDNKDKFPSGLFYIGENDLFTTMTTNENEP